MKGKKMIHISKMTGKLEGFQAISTNTVTNSYCNKQYKKQDPNNICSFCYSNEMLRTYRKSVATALQRNSDLLTSKVLHEDALPIINNAFFRFNAHGELDLDKTKAKLTFKIMLILQSKDPIALFFMVQKVRCNKTVF